MAIAAPPLSFLRDSLQAAAAACTSIDQCSGVCVSGSSSSSSSSVDDDDDDKRTSPWDCGERAACLGLCVLSKDPFLSDAARLTWSLRACVCASSASSPSELTTHSACVRRLYIFRPRFSLSLSPCPRARQSKRDRHRGDTRTHRE